MSRSVNGDRVFFSEPTSSRLDFIKSLDAHRQTTRPAKLTQARPVDSGGSLHVANMDTMSPLVKSCPHGLSVQPSDNCQMIDCWPKRVWFKKLLSDYREQNHVTNSDIAEKLGISPESLKKYISPSPTHRPGEAVLRKAGEMLGIDWRQFLDDGAVVAEDYDPSFASIMGFLGPNIPEDVKKHLIALAQTYQPKGVVLVDPAAGPDFIVQSGQEAVVVEVKGSGQAKAPSRNPLGRDTASAPPRKKTKAQKG